MPSGFLPAQVLRGSDRLYSIPGVDWFRIFIVPSCDARYVISIAVRLVVQHSIAVTPENQFSSMFASDTSATETLSAYPVSPMQPN